jgi:uncharacterized protein
VYRHQAPLTREVCEAARRWRVPVLYDVAGAAHTLEMIAPRYPDVPFIIPHLGSFADDWRAHVTVIDVLTRYPNVYADTSGLRRQVRAGRPVSSNTCARVLAEEAARAVVGHSW